MAWCGRHDLDRLQTHTRKQHLMRPQWKTERKQKRYVCVRACVRTCVSLGVSGCVWMCLGISGCVWVCLGVSGCVWCVFVEARGSGDRGE